MIEQINGYTPVTQSAAPTKTEKSANGDLFRQLLGEAVQSKSESIQESGSYNESIATGALSELSSTRDITLNSTTSEIENKTDELIEKLSLYSSQLENPAISLKDMDSLLQEINTSAGNLLQKTADSGDTDSDLMDIVRECAITAHSEYIKFQRGDYLDSVA